MIRNDEMNEKIKFLSDQPLRFDEIRQVKFGHEGIAETVKNIVLACPTPFTIGLFGKWGTGKSTITNLLQKKLEQKSIVVVKFDVWKYEGDPLRRTVLQSVVDVFKEKHILEKDYTLEKDLYQTITINSEGETKFSWGRLKKLIPYLIGSYIITFFVFMLLRGTENASMILLESLIIPILLVVLQDVKNIVVTDQRSTTYKSIESPEKFEAKFQEILRRSKGKKVVIVVDNLDRCAHKKAIELLSTIKTFLEVPKDKGECIFVIPCDDNAIKEHLENIYGADSSTKKKPKAFDSDEFLRKFFNAYVRIPDFIDTELQDYTEELLKETGAKKLDNSEVAYVITTAFRDNPRQIKQFINTLLSHYLLVQEREECQNPLIVPKGTITDSVGFLTKLLAIRHKSPEVYENIKKKRLNSIEINKLTPDDPDLREFLNSTSSIPKRGIRSIRPFIYLKQPEEELKIPNAEDLELALVDNKQDIVNEEFKHLLKSPKLLGTYNKFTQSLIKENGHRPTPLLNIIRSSLTALKKNNLEFPSIEYYNETARLLGITLKDQLHILEPSLVFNQIIDRCDKQSTSNILSQYAKILSSQNDEKKTIEVNDEWAYELFQNIINHPSLFKENSKDISKALSETYYSNTNILSLFKDKTDVQKDFISEEVLFKFISTLSGDDIEDKVTLNKKIQLFLNFKNIVTPNVIQELIKRFGELLKGENQQPFREQKEHFLSNIENILDTYHALIAKIKDENVLLTFNDAIIEGINAIGDLNQRKIFMPLGLRLKDSLADPAKGNINNLITAFWDNTDQKGFEFVLNKLGEDAKQKVIGEYLGIFQRRSEQQQEIFNAIWSFSKKENRLHLFRHVIGSGNYNWALSKLEELGYKIDFDKKEAVSILLGRVENIPLNNRNEFYKAINIMKCGIDDDLRKKYVEQIKALLKNPDLNSQKIGFDALYGATYLSKTLKREIAREIIDWLRQLSPINYNYQYSIRSVVLNWNVLPLTPKKDYMDLIFDKFLKSSPDINDIRLGFEIIQQTKPKYREYKSYVDDVLERIEKEENNDIRKELKNGLIKIFPSLKKLKKV